MKKPKNLPVPSIPVPTPRAIREIIKWLIDVPSWGGRDRWLAELVVALVGEKAKIECNNPYYAFLHCPNQSAHIKTVLHGENITPEQFEEIKKRLQN